MPFDYNSFMQGVITGLKLGRVPRGRTPPAPSGRYILTQEGIPIVSETEVDWGDISVFDTDVWYNLAAPFYDSYTRKTFSFIRYRFQLYYYSGGNEFVPGNIFFVSGPICFTNIDYDWVSCTTHPMTELGAEGDMVRVWVDLKTTQGEEHLSFAGTIAARKLGENEQGINYMWYHHTSTYWNRYIPAGVEHTLDASISTDIVNYMDDRTLIPLITE